MFLQRLFNSLAQRFQNLDTRKVLVVGFHQCPRGDFGAGAINHVAYRVLILRPFTAVTPVFLGDLEAFESDFLARLETLELLLLADGEPELDHHDVMASQLRLKIVDLAVCAHPVRF